jgi:hypothetical protein
LCALLNPRIGEYFPAKAKSEIFDDDDDDDDDDNSGYI